jgi:hypothetical protein
MGQTRFEEFPGTARELIDITAHGDWDEVGDQVNFKRGQPAFDSLAGPAGVKRALDYAVKYLGVEGSKNKLRIGNIVRAVVDGKRVQGEVIGISSDYEQVELWLSGVNDFNPITVDVRDIKPVSEQGVAEGIPKEFPKNKSQLGITTDRGPTWSFQEIADKLNISLNTLTRLAFLLTKGFPEAVPGLSSKHGSKKYYRQNEVKRWVIDNNVREKIKQSMAEADSNAMADTAKRLADKNDGKVAKLRAAGDKRREAELKGRDIAKRNEAMLPKSAFVGSDKNKLGPAAHAKGKQKGPVKKGQFVGGMEEEKKKGADGKACWKGYRYAGTENGKDKCVPVSEDVENIMATLINKIIFNEAIQNNK